MTIPKTLFAFLSLLLLQGPSFGAFGLSTATDSYTVDTDAGLVFKIRRTDNGSNTQSAGDIMSLVYNGIEYQDQSRGSQINSGFDYLYSGSSSTTGSSSMPPILSSPHRDLSEMTFNSRLKPIPFTATNSNGHPLWRQTTGTTSAPQESGIMPSNPSPTPTPCPKARDFIAFASNSNQASIKNPK